jgi:hypothetical protein
MTLAQLQTALKAWVVALAGLNAARDPVVFANEPRPMHNGTLALLTWVSGAGVGRDETRYEDNAAPAPAPDLVPVVVGNRVRVLQVEFITLSQDPAAPSALALIEQVRNRLRWESSKTALDAMNLGLIDSGVITVPDGKSDQRWRARTLLEVRFNASSFERDTAGAAPSIATVEVTSHLSNVDGTQLPAAQQFDHEVMP